MDKLIKQAQKEFDEIDKMLNKAHKSIFILEDSMNVIEHEFMELYTSIENLGITLNELEGSLTNENC